MGPALASAHVGIVLQEVGTQATVDAASAVLRVDIDQLPAAVTIARRARRLVLTNLLLALSINVAVTNLLLVVLANSLWPQLLWAGMRESGTRGGAHRPSLTRELQLRMVRYKLLH